MFLPNNKINVAEVFENAILQMRDKRIEIKSQNWVPHPNFENVHIKTIVDSEKSNGMFSFHLMYLEPDAEIVNCELDGMLEVHSVIEGDGVCKIDDNEIKYLKGIVHNISDGEIFNLRAGLTGLKLLVIYAPGYWD